jgi:hypothetical protein
MRGKLAVYSAFIALLFSCGKNDEMQLSGRDFDGSDSDAIWAEQLIDASQDVALEMDASVEDVGIDSEWDWNDAEIDARDEATLTDSSTDSTKDGSADRQEILDSTVEPVDADEDVRDSELESDSVAHEASTLICQDDPLFAPVDDPPIEQVELHQVEVTPHAFFKITVMEQETELPISGVRLETTNHISLLTDINGVAAFYEPGLMDATVYFYISHPNYEKPTDYFGNQGIALWTEEGGSAEVYLTPIEGAPAPAVDSDQQTRLAEGPVPGPDACFAIEFIDQATGRGVPLVRLSLEEQQWWTDSNGIIAFCDPDQIGERVVFDLFSHGYRLRTGKSLSLNTSPGGSEVVDLERINVAERLYRVTGQGIYRDSVLLGRAVPVEQPVLNGRVMGQDSVQSEIYREKIFWIWGDTTGPHYPLGNFHASSARSSLPELGGLPPSAGVDLTYFVDANGFCKKMAPPESLPTSNLTWLWSLMAVPNAEGIQKLLATYAIIQSEFTAIELGIVRYDDQSETFEKIMTYPTTDAISPTGHPTRIAHEDREYFYFQPPLRIPADVDSILEPSTYQTYTAFATGSTTEFVRDPEGNLSYDFKEQTGYVTQDALEAAGIGADQSLDGHMREPETGRSIIDHSHHSKNWNDYRGRFSKIVQEVYGQSSFLGEIWYVEGDTPMGPWVYSRKIVTHDDYTFYNPRQHPFFDQQGGRLLYFEGTYSYSFSGGSRGRTPRYDYNQIMYRLDLDDPRVNLPVAVYDLGTELPGDFATKQDLGSNASKLRPVFFAHERKKDELIGVGWSGPRCSKRRLVVNPPDPLPSVFYALPPDAESAPPNTQPLYEYIGQEGQYSYNVEPSADLEGFERQPEPLALVWSSPVRVKFPVSDYLGDLVAEAGDDQCLTESEPDAGAIVTLDGTGSRSSKGAITVYVWEVPSAHGCPIEIGSRVTVSLPVGTHLIRLKVQDDHGNRDADTLLVEVAQGG